MAKKSNKTTTVRVDLKDYHRLEALLEEEYGTTRVPFAVGVSHLLDEYEDDN